MKDALTLALAKRRLLSLGLVLLLSACATATHEMARDPLKAPPKAGEVMVVVSITVNTPQVGAVDGIQLERVKPGSDKPSYYHLPVIAPGMARDTSLFAGVLPEGEYQFKQLQHAASQRYLPLGATQAERIGRFAVGGSQAADLGRLIVTPVNVNVVVGRSALAGNNQALLRRFSPEHAALFGGAEPAAGWLEPRKESDRVEAYAFGRPTGALIGPQASDGRVLAASRLGTVLVRSVEGRWSALRSGKLEALMYVAPIEAGDVQLVAVGEFSTLLKQRRDSQVLEPIDPGNLPKGNLIFIAGNTSAGWYVALEAGKKVQLLHAKQLEAGDWQLQREEDVSLSMWSGANPLWFWPTRDGLAYATASGGLHFLNFSNRQWTRRPSPEGNRFIAVSPNVDGSLGALTSPGGGLGGVFAKMYLSRDDGQSWKLIPSGEVSVRIMAPMTLSDGTLLMAGGVFSNPSVYTSKNEGQTWTRMGASQLDRSFVPLPSGLLLAVDRGQYGLFGIDSSSDQGASWKREYSNFDREAYLAQNPPKDSPKEPPKDAKGAK